MFDLSPPRQNTFGEALPHLTKMETELALKQVAELWVKVSHNRGYLDYADCTDWPDPMDIG